MKLGGFILLVLVFAGASWLWFQRQADQTATTNPVALKIFCAAGIKSPVEAVAAAYQNELGVRAELQYGGTASLLSSIRVAGGGDLFVAADDAAIVESRKLGLIREVLPLVTQTPVIAVIKGNPKGIRTLDDLLRADVKFALANPESASVGRISKRILKDRWESFSGKAAVMKPTVMEIATDVKIGSVDAAIVWDSAVAQFPELEAVTVPELAASPENASIAVLAGSTNPTAALRFARYLTSPEKGGPIFSARGFKPARGDQWAEKPRFVIYSGGVNRPAIQQTLQEFADREGVDLTTVFNGCGVLCASMKAMSQTPGNQLPDVYYACDVCFVPPVAEMFPEAIVLTEADIVLAVNKGNPRNIRSIADLAQPNLKVGICNAEQATLGFMTKAMLKQAGLLPAVMKNVCSQVPTADLLVNQLRTGSLDAAIVYEINARPAAEFIDTISIPASAGAKAVQPFAVAAKTPYPLLAHRLLDCLKSNRARFEEAGFRWRDDPTIPSKDIVLPDYLKNANNND
ncbi:extracellular solute-binding protein [Humisphaera borealis]|uniref:Extracellular solute-binding protein n=1 Tax=Humisphaera borealis TaxID=2807512 RepID=A0A7M2WW94_9BACT|nr:extracellular solute-binding protein [Humisphaera borealis]QOV89736.1 extracellular solute-binding protein [Humisphaera borealis]